MNVDMSAPVVCEESVVMNARPRDIWEVVSYIESWPRWMRDVQSVSKESLLVEGCVFHWRLGPVPFRSTVRVVDRLNVLAFTGQGPGIQAAHVYRLQELGSGTVVTSRESWNGRVPRWFPTLTSSALRGSLKRTLDDVKAEVHNEVSGAPETAARIAGNQSVTAAAVSILREPVIRLARRSRF